MTVIQPNRRGFLKSTLGMAATVAAARIAFPGGAWAATPTPEVTGAKLGHIALTDSAPLIIAVEKGLFAKHGMPDVLVEKQASWGPRATTWRWGWRRAASTVAISCGPRCIFMRRAR
jgi:nitrate/nitrite transport system substrate-binding protein